MCLSVRPRHNVVVAKNPLGGHPSRRSESPILTFSIALDSIFFPCEIHHAYDVIALELYFVFTVGNRTLRLLALGNAVASDGVSLHDDRSRRQVHHAASFGHVQVQGR